MTLAEYKQLPEIPVTSKSTLCKWCRKLGFWYKQCNKNLKQADQLFDVDVVPPACTFLNQDSHTGAKL